MGPVWHWSVQFFNAYKCNLSMCLRLGRIILPYFIMSRIKIIKSLLVTVNFIFTCNHRNQSSLSLMWAADLFYEVWLADRPMHPGKTVQTGSGLTSTHTPTHTCRHVLPVLTKGRCIYCCDVVVDYKLDVGNVKEIKHYMAGLQYHDRILCVMSIITIC